MQGIGLRVLVRMGSELRLVTQLNPVSLPKSSLAAKARPVRKELQEGLAVNSTYFGLLAEFGEAHVPLERVAPKYFGLSFDEARRRAPAKLLPCRAFRLGGQKSPWLISVTDLADLIDRQRDSAA